VTNSENLVSMMAADLSAMAQPGPYTIKPQAMNKAFRLKDSESKPFMSAVSGKPIPIGVMGDTPFEQMIPAFDDDYVMDAELLKNLSVAVGENMPVLMYGFHGTGKSSLFKQYCAATRRPYVRVQHTGNTEEQDLLGTTLARDGATYFAPGVLAMAMRFGWFLNLDEYDMADPSVTAVYQPVLEGEPLFIKEAPPEWRFVQPHPDFRIGATANTNGSGDETGLYQGTNLGNAANYSRFSVACRVDYMDKDQEARIVMQKAGVREEDARNFVEFATMVRSAFISKKITNTIGQRELIAAAKLGVARVSWTKGLQLAFVNRLSEQDRAVVDMMLNTVFASESEKLAAVV